MYTPLICHKCKKLTKTPHWRSCGKFLDKNKFLLETFQENFTLDVFNKDLIYDLYIVKENPMRYFLKEYKIHHKKMSVILKYHGIKERDISKANNTNAVKELYKNTCFNRFGASNALSKGTEIYTKRNSTVKLKYGVSNVFELESVKILIKNQIPDLIVKRNKTRSLWSDEQKYAIQSKRLTSYYNFSKMNRLESRVAECLTFAGVSYEWSFVLKGRQYDFRVNNFLLEINGDFWHANPKYYHHADVLNHPGKNVKAGDLWLRDSKKSVLAAKHGFQMKVLWEDDIRSCSDLQLTNKILDLLK